MLLFGQLPSPPPRGQAPQTKPRTGVVGTMADDMQYPHYIAMVVLAQGMPHLRAAGPLFHPPPLRAVRRGGGVPPRGMRPDAM